MEELRRIMAINIQGLRLRSGMTQQELADKLNYTDKAISKWERGESAPDVSVLKKLAGIFGVTLDYLVTDHRNEPEPIEDEAPLSEGEYNEVELVAVKNAELSYGSPAPAPAENDLQQSRFANLASVFGYTPGHFNVALMSAAGVWLAAVITYVVLSVFLPSFEKSWLCFVFAVPASIAVLLIFNLIWGEMRYSFTLMSLLLWTGLASVFLFFSEQKQHWKLFLIGLPAQILLILWSKFYKRKAN